tara:strand:- start:124 stop:837 length:714 start_codon:yes stop_codon:yes gene_type:complete
MVYIIAGASGVLGSAIAEDLSKNNELFLIGRDKEKLLKMSEKYDCKYEIIDLNNPIPQREFKNVIDPDVEIKGLINCIGSILIKPLHGTSIEEYNDVINTNLFSSFYFLSTFAKRMKNGSALFFSSVAASLGLSNHEVISAAKSGIEGFVRSAAATYSKDNLRINAIAPSIMDSNMSNKILSTEQAIEISKSMHPIPKIGTYNDILPVVRWLMSNDADWVTGQTINIDGGLSKIKPR